VPWRDGLGDLVELWTVAGERTGLAFDHDYLVGQAVAWLRRETWRGDLPLTLVRDRFTLRQLQDVYEAILDEPLFRTSFRRRLVDVMRLIRATGERVEAEPRRPEIYTRATPAES
jgi:8-oxo-dGTP diphosphatase